MTNPISIVKSDGTKEIFDENKLVNSLKRVGAAPETIEEIVDEVEAGMREGMSTVDIYRSAFGLLKRHHGLSAVKYSIRRALLDLGPDGFPFEQYVARIFKLWGYETATDQHILGTCVEHEVDVVAWKGDELSMCEAKFHNVFGLKSDVKVALYVKARFDDIANTVVDYGGKKRKLSDKGHWLVTNTKFTDMAVKYAECNNINMIGWNYPDKGNLHQIIEQNGLHPVTCLNSLTHQEKKEVIASGILTCIDLIGSPEILRTMRLAPDSIERVIAEAQLVVQQAK